MAEGVTGNTPRVGNRNPRSAGAVEETRPYTSVPLVPDYKGRCVRVLRSLVAKNVRNTGDQPDAEQYDGRVVRRGFRPTR